VAFAGAAGGDLGGLAFVGVAERKTGDHVGISVQTGAYGLADGGGHRRSQHSHRSDNACVICIAWSI
jgi:hypothetical protein